MLRAERSGGDAVRHALSAEDSERAAGLIAPARPAMGSGLNSVAWLGWVTALIKESKKAGDAGYVAGYNSLAQISRRYERHFGFAVSAA